MYSALHRARYQVVTLAAVAVGFSTSPALAEELMPSEQQNALVQKYCAVCHTDATKNGGLSLEHFDAAQAPPSLTAMLLSKLTGGVSLKTAREAPCDPSAKALMDRKMKSGAMGAAGIPIPDKPIIDALIRAFTLQSAGAMDWIIGRSKHAASGPTLTASMLQEILSTKNSNEAEVCRLIVSCNSATQEGEVQLAWSPVAQNGTLAASVDGKAAIQFRVEGSERMGNGSGVVLRGLAALVLAQTRSGADRTGLPFPAESLSIRGLFPGETVMFSFANLPEDARQEFNMCFPGAAASNHLASNKSRRSDQ